MSSFRDVVIDQKRVQEETWHGMSGIVRRMPIADWLLNSPCEAGNPLPITNQNCISINIVNQETKQPLVSVIMPCYKMGRVVRFSDWTRHGGYIAKHGFYSLTFVALRNLFTL